MRKLHHALPLLALLTLSACWSTTTPTPEPSPEMDSAELRAKYSACDSDDECDRIVTTCCACGADDYMGVNKKYKREAAAAFEDRSKCDCPAQDCPPHKEVCQAGVCQVVER